jgi:class 3 adenylate cyclase/tetratricopeptide (TPR) repeat protein
VPSADLLTILFTDWVGSTATRVGLGEERADELQHVHDALLREVIGEHSGTVVKGSGDGVLATFESATDALAASVAIQQRMDEYSRKPDAIAVIELRIGVSVGDVVHQDGDIFGTPVVEAKRLEEAAGTGQVLCSELVRLLARGRGGYEFDMIGLLELKGLPEAVAACAVRWERAVRSSGLPLPLQLTTGGGARFVGRARELDEAIELFCEVQQAHALWLLGEPGIGKTRLATEVAVRAHATGALVLFGRCDEDVNAPFQPVIQALRWFAGQVDDERLAAELGVDPEPLARLVPEIRSRLPGLAAEPGTVTEAEQYRLFDAVRSWLASVSVDTPVVFVVDDVHWADKATLGMIGHISRSAEPARLLVVGTARDTDPDSSDALGDLVDDLDRLGRSRSVSLAGLTTDDVAALVEAAGVSTARPERFAAHLTNETAGNPLFVAAVLAGWRNDEEQPDALPSDVRVAVRRRVRRLSESTQELLQVAAIVGLEFPLGTVLRAAAVDERDGLARVEQAVRAGLAAEIAIDRFRFTHALVRDALVDELSASRRARVHAAVAEAIETRAGGVQEDDLHALAHHYARAGADPSTLARAHQHAIASAETAMRMLAFDVAVTDYALALEISTSLQNYPPTDAVDLLIAKGGAEMKDRSHARAITTLTSAARLAESLADWERFGVAVIACEEAAWRPGLAGASRLLADGIAHSADMSEALAIRVRASYGRSLHYEGEGDRARRVTAEALALARKLGDPVALAHALQASIQALYPVDSRSVHSVLERAEEIWNLAGHLNDVDVLFNAAQYALVGSLVLGDRASLTKWYARVVDVTERLGTRFSRYVKATDEQYLAFVDGDLARAEALIEECELLGGELHEDASGVSGGQVFIIRREQDRLRELVPIVRMLLSDNSDASMWQPGLVLLLAEVGMHDEARVRLDQLAANRCAAVPRDDIYPVVLGFLCEAVALTGATHLVGDLRAELTIYGPALGGGHAFAYMGCVRLHFGLLAELEGDLQRAAGDFDAAIAFEREMRAPVFLARALLYGARVSLRLGDLSGAQGRANEAATIADRHGLAAVRRDIGELGLL